MAVVVIERDFATIWDASLDALPSDPIDEDDAAAILFTSGTTGRPSSDQHPSQSHLFLFDLDCRVPPTRCVSRSASATFRRTGDNNVSAVVHVSGLQSAIWASRTVFAIWTTGVSIKQILEITA